MTDHGPGPPVDPSLLTLLSVNMKAEVSGSNIKLIVSDHLERILILPLALPAVLGMLILGVVGLYMTLTGHSTRTGPDAILGLLLYLLFSLGLLWKLLGRIGTETLQLTPNGLEYRAGIGLWRRREVYAWTEITNLQVYLPLPQRHSLTSGSLQWTQTSSGRTIFIGRNIPTADNQTVLKILQQYQAAALRTPAVNS